MFKIYKCWDAAPDPQLPAVDLSGEIPSRALKFCEPFLVANAMGVLICPPVDLTLTWTGNEILGNLGDIEETVLIDRVFLPDYAEYWKSIALPPVQKILPPFIEAFPERGVLQIWTGLFVATDLGTSTWIRSPINRNRSSGYSITEGVVDTDWWHGPLFFVMQIERTDFPVVLKRNEPVLQIVPIARELSRCRPEDIQISLIETADQAFWSSMLENGERRNSEPAGSYRRESRRRNRINRSEDRP